MKNGVVCVCLESRVIKRSRSSVGSLELRIEEVDQRSRINCEEVGGGSHYLLKERGPAFGPGHLASLHMK